MRNLVKLLCVSAIGLAASPALANPIVNGDFETGYGTDIPGWLVVKSLNDPFIPESILLMQGADYAPCCNVVGAGSSAAALDNHFLSFGAGQVPNNARIFQNFLVAPGTYTLDFDFGAIQGTQTMSYGVFDFGTDSFLTYGSITSSGGQNLDTLFGHYSFQFTTMTGNLSLQFNNWQSDTYNSDAFIDNVSVNPVPEPATWAMMIGGFALVGGTLRRKKVAVNFA